MFKAIKSGPIIIHLIEEDNFNDVLSLFSENPDAEYMQSEFEKSYRPRYDDSGRRTKYGFYVIYKDKLAGGTLLGISSWENLRGYTGADILTDMRGQAIASQCKPLLFYLAFEILRLNRVETGCRVTNIASIKSISKTPGFVFEGTLRGYCRNPDGSFEDEHRWAILKDDWLRLYDISAIEVIS